MSSSFIDQLPPVWRTSTLGWHRDDVAQSYMEHIMQRIVSIVKKRRWHVGHLKEFYPRGASLLGLNASKGQEISIRFRVPGRKEEFLPFHEVVCTTLHELAHCEVSPHNNKFWSLYYELVRECEAWEVKMIAQGVSIYPPHISDPSTLAPNSTAVGGKPKKPGRSGPRTVKKNPGKPNTRAAGAKGSGASNEPPKATSASTFIGTGHPFRWGDSSIRGSTAEERRAAIAAAIERRATHTQRPQHRDVGGGVGLTESSEETVPVPSNSDLDEEKVQQGRLSLSQVAALSAAAYTQRESEFHGAASTGGWPCDRCGYRNSDDVLACTMCCDAVSDDEVVFVTPLAKANEPAMATKRPRVETDPQSGSANDPISISDSETD